MLSILRRIGLELLFVGVALPLSVVFMIIGLLWGTFTAALYSNRLKARAPWREVASVASLLRKHFRYLYLGYYLPWRTNRNLRAQQESMKKNPRREEWVKTISTPAFDAIDAEVFFLLVLQCLPYIVLLPHAIIATVALVSVWGIKVHYGVAELPTGHVPEVRVVYEPQIADRQEADFGPWLSRGEVLERSTQNTFLNIALLSDIGTVRYSQNKVALSAGFETRVSEKIVNPRVEGRQVHFHDQHDNVFVLNLGQAFLIEGYKSYAFMFDNDGQLTAVPLNQLKTQEVR